MTDHIEKNEKNNEKINEEIKKTSEDKINKENNGISNKQSTKESSIQNSGCYNFLANLSNQANLTNAYSTSPFQANAIFVLVSPYYVEKFNLEGFDLNINIDDKGTVFINGEAFSTFEVKPGIKVFGISKRN